MACKQGGALLYFISSDVVFLFISSCQKEPAVGVQWVNFFFFFLGTEEGVCAFWWSRQRDVRVEMIDFLNRLRL